MDIKIHAYNEHATTGRGKTTHVCNRPSYKLEKSPEGLLSLNIEVNDDEMVGTGEWGGKRSSVKYICRTATVEIGHEELRELALSLHNALFGSRQA